MPQHGAVLHGMHSLMGDHRIFYRSNSPDAFITLFCLQNPFEPTVLPSKNTSLCANTPCRAGGKKQMVFIFAVDLNHIGKSQCFIWESLVYNVRMCVCISAGPWKTKASGGVLNAPWMLFWKGRGPPYIVFQLHSHVGALYSSRHLICL